MSECALQLGAILRTQLLSQEKNETLKNINFITSLRDIMIMVIQIKGDGR